MRRRCTCQVQDTRDTDDRGCAVMKDRAIGKDMELCEWVSGRGAAARGRVQVAPPRDPSPVPLIRRIKDSEP